MCANIYSTKQMVYYNSMKLYEDKKKITLFRKVMKKNTFYLSYV